MTSPNTIIADLQAENAALRIDAERYLYTPGKVMHAEDINALTEYWHRETNHINDLVDSSFKSAQDDAYARGYRRAREDLIAIRKQRDDLLAALKLIEPSLDFAGWESGFGEPIGKEINVLISSVKVSA